MKKISFLIWDIEYGGGGETITNTLAWEFAKQFDVTIVSVCNCIEKEENNVRYRSILPNKITCNIQNISTNQAQIETYLTNLSCDTLIVQEGKLAYLIDFNKIDACRKNIVVHHYSPVATIDTYNYSAFYLKSEQSLPKRIVKTILYPLIRWRNVKKATAIAQQNMTNAIRNSTQTVVLCKQAMDIVMKLVGLEAQNKIKIIPNSLPLPAVVNFEKENKTAIFVGRVEAAKGIYNIIEIWKKVIEKHCDAQLKIFGQLSDPHIEQQLKSLPNIQLIGYCNQMEQVYQNADLILHTSYTEGFPMVLIESLAHGVIPVTFDCNTGPADIIQNLKTGFVINPRNNNQFAATVNQWLNTPETEKNQFRQEAVNASKQYSIQAIYKQWFEIM